MTNADTGFSAVWFKVQENGREGTSNVWGSTPLQKAGGSVTYTIPKCISSGYYLVRHELLALHAAYQYPGKHSNRRMKLESLLTISGAQFYPGCHQLKVTGGGSTKPSGLVGFPGAYKGSDAGITYDAYKGTSSLQTATPIVKNSC
jgi:hypothetical protein